MQLITHSSAYKLPTGNEIIVKMATDMRQVNATATRHANDGFVCSQSCEVLERICKEICQCKDEEANWTRTPTAAGSLGTTRCLFAQVYKRGGGGGGLWVVREARNESGTKMKSKSEISIISAQKFPRHTGRTHVSLSLLLHYCHAHSEQQAGRMCPSLPHSLCVGFCYSSVLLHCLFLLSVDQERFAFGPLPGNIDDVWPTNLNRKVPLLHWFFRVENTVSDFSQN